MKCKYPECGREGTTRGLCQGHYNAATKLIKKGLTSWEKLEQEGKAKAGGIGGRKQGLGAVSKWFLGQERTVTKSLGGVETHEALEEPMERAPEE